MSSRRARASRTSEDELNELIFKLQALLTESSSRCTTRVISLPIINHMLHQAIEGCQYHVKWKSHGANFRSDIVLRNGERTKLPSHKTKNEKFSFSQFAKMSSSNRNNTNHDCFKVSPSKILKETCSYIKKLHREVDDLSERLSQLLASMDTSGLDVEILKSLLQQ